MSRVGKHPVEIPSGVTLSIAGNLVKAKGKLGELEATLTDDVELSQEGQMVTVRPRNESKRARMMWGTARTVVSNLVNGVDTGFSRKLEINGVGYRAQVQGSNLVLQLGYSHEVTFPIQKGSRSTVRIRRILPCTVPASRRWARWRRRSVHSGLRSPIRARASSMKTK